MLLVAQRSVSGQLGGAGSLTGNVTSGRNPVKLSQPCTSHAHKCARVELSQTFSNASNAHFKLKDERLTLAVCEFPKINNCFLNSYLDINSRAFTWQSIGTRQDVSGKVLFSLNLN